MLKDAVTVASLIDTLVVFKNLKNGEVLSSFKALLNGTTMQEKIKHYSDFVSALYKYGYDFSEYLLNAAASDENNYSYLRAKSEEIPKILGECVKGELTVLQTLSDITCLDLVIFIGFNKGFLPPFSSKNIDFAKKYEERMTKIAQTGYGIFADNIMFRINDDGEIEAVSSPDERGIERLIGYEKERQQLIDNTESLLNGRPAANVLLYGDAGTGKSSSVKAVANMLAERGLRLIEVRKNQLGRLTAIMEKLRDNPLKFIIFIDDLSFNSADDNFGALKTVLEGSTAVKADNTVIYATSNRRHLIRESFADRAGDDVHRNDTLQEMNALSARFGLAILFSRPNKALYIDIVRELCKARSINVDIKDIEKKADAFALRKGGYSPRAAEQFADSLLALQKEED